MKKYKSRGLLLHVWKSASKTAPRDSVFNLVLFMCFLAMLHNTQDLSSSRGIEPFLLQWKDRFSATGPRKSLSSESHFPGLTLFCGPLPVWIGPT